MKAIIDTHALIWAVDDPERLGSAARALVDDSANEILFSSGSIWELAIKISIGKFNLNAPLEPFISQQLQVNSIDLLETGLATLMWFQLYRFITETRSTACWLPRLSRMAYPS